MGVIQVGVYFRPIAETCSGYVLAKTVLILPSSSLFFFFFFCSLFGACSEPDSPILSAGTRTTMDYIVKAWTQVKMSEC